MSYTISCFDYALITDQLSNRARLTPSIVARACWACELQVDMGRDVRLRMSIFVLLEDPVTEIQHVLRLEALLLTFPKDMPLGGLEKEAGAAVKSTVQCIVKVMHVKRW